MILVTFHKKLTNSFIPTVHITYRETPIPLKPEKWSPVLANVSKIKADYCYRNKIPICSEKETASTEDRMSLGTVCFWEGTYDGAEMSHFCNTAVNLAGRSSDISDSDLSDLRTVTMPIVLPSKPQEERLRHLLILCSVGKSVDSFGIECLVNSVCANLSTPLSPPIFFKAISLNIIMHRMF